MNRRSFCRRGFASGAGILLAGTRSRASTTRRAAPELSPIDESPREVAAVASELFAAHGRGDTAAIEALYWPGATVSVRLRGTDGQAVVMAQPVKSSTSRGLPTSTRLVRRWSST